MRLILSKLDQDEAFPDAWSSARQTDHFPDNLQNGIDGYDVCARCLSVLPLVELLPYPDGTGLRLCREHMRRHMQQVGFDPKAITQDWLRAIVQRAMSSDGRKLGRLSPGRIPGTDLRDTAEREATGLMRNYWMTERETLRDAYTGVALQSLTDTSDVYGNRHSE